VKVARDHPSACPARSRFVLLAFLISRLIILRDFILVGGTNLHLLPRAMSAQKRPAADTLLPHRLSKHPRRALFQDAPPEPSLGEQWLSLGSNLGQLVVATASSFFAGPCRSLSSLSP
jgi:hypothetical protein